MMYQGGGYGYGGMHGGYGYGYSPYGMGGGRRGMLLQDEFDCIGGCPMNAFCDYGICRCRTGYDARYVSSVMEYLKNRDRPRFFDQFGHQTTNVSIGKKYFFTK